MHQKTTTHYLGNTFYHKGSTDDPVTVSCLHCHLCGATDRAGHEKATNFVMFCFLGGKLERNSLLGLITKLDSSKLCEFCIFWVFF